MTEGPDDGAKQDIQFSDMPKPRRPKTKPQENYVPQASSASATTTKLLQKRRKNTEWQQLLELKREEFAKRMAECDARQAELKKKCKDLRKRVQTEEQHVQETRSKIDRATKKQQEEKGFQEQKDEEIKEKQTEMEEANRKYISLQKELERTNKFKQYLDLVCEQNEGYFEEVDRIIQRFESLSTTEEDLQTKRKDMANMINTQREELARFSKGATTQVVEENARMARMRGELESLKNNLKDRSAEAMKRTDEEQQRVKDLGSIHMAVDNLFNRCFVLGKEKLSKGNQQEIDKIKAKPEQERICEMLNRLCTYYIDIREISKEAEGHQKKPVYEYQGRGAREKKPKANATTAAATGAVGTVDDGGAAANKALEDAISAKDPNQRRDSVLQQPGRRRSVMSSEMSSARGSGAGSEIRPQSGNKS